MTKPLRGADIVARSLARLGCRHVFTLSGNHIMSIFDAALEAELDLVHVRHEAAAVHMADAWGRLTGDAGIALVTGGPGHANAVGALFTALGAESPMVLLSGHAATWELGRGGFQEIRQADMAAPVTKASWTATSAATLGHELDKAIRIATSGRPGPVHLSLPSDLLEERVESNAIVWPDTRRIAAPAPALAEAVADAVLAAIAGAERPLILAGPAPIEPRRARAHRQAGDCDQGAGRDHGEPARHRRCHARGVPGSGAARRSDRAARQGAGLHDPMGIGSGLRSRRAADRDRSRGGAGRARRQRDGRPAAPGLPSPTSAAPPRRSSPAPRWSRRATAIGCSEARAALDHRPAAWATCRCARPRAGCTRPKSSAPCVLISNDMPTRF